MICGGTDCIYRMPFGSDTYCNKIDIEPPSTLKWFYDQHGVTAMTDELWKEWAVTPCPFYRNAKGTQKRKRLSVTYQNVDWDKALELYKKGLSDKDIAYALHISKGTVFRWRRDKALPTLFSGGTFFNEKKVLELYKQGLPDFRIAQETGYNAKRIKKWRTDNGLEYKREYKVKYDYTKAFELHAAGMRDVEIAEAIGASTGAVKHWRQRNGLEANGFGRRRKRR